MVPLYAFNADGTVKWSYSTGSFSQSSPVIGSDGTIYVGTIGGVFAIGSDGTLKWSYTSISANTTPVIDSDGTLYVGTSAGLYAFNDYVANYSYVVGSNPLYVEFTDASSDAVSWSWDFGDGTTSTEQNPTHTYSESGQYTVNLTAILSNGYVRTATKIITVSDVTPPSVSISPVWGVFSTTQIVTLTATDDTDNVTVYYTLDGSDPLTSSTRIVYTDPITLTDTTTISYVAVDSSGNQSPIYDETFEKSDSEVIVIYVQDGYTNDQIQAIIDNAEPGSTIEFLGLSYEDLHLTIDKSLNIISNIGTVITSSSSSAVFQFEGATDSKISGFTIVNNGTGPAILVNYSSNVTISNVNVSSINGTAIKVNGGLEVTIKSSTISDSLVGISVSDSDDTQISKNNIYNNNKGINIVDSRNTTINKNQILNNEDKGICIENSITVTVSDNKIDENGYGLLINNVTDALVEGNDILDNDRDGITLNGTIKDITILSNVIQENNIGIYFNCVNENLSIIGNLITDNTVKSGDKNHGGFGLDFGSNFIESSTFLVEHNIVYYNEEMDFHGCTYPGDYLHGSNWLGTYCKEVDYDPQMIMTITKTGDNAFTVKFYDGATGELITDFPSVTVTFKMATATQEIIATGGIATAIFNNMPLAGQIIATCYGHTVSINYNTEITNPDTENEPDDNPNNNDGDGDGNGAGNGSGGDDNSGSEDGSDGNDNSNSDDVSGDDNTDPNGASDPDEVSDSNDSSDDDGSSDVDVNSGSDSDTNSVPEDVGSDSDGETASEDTEGKVSYSATSVSSIGDSPDDNGGSSSNQAGSSKTVQELIVNDVTNNGGVWSIIGIVILLISVILTYYRKDIIKMIQKSKN